MTLQAGRIHGIIFDLDGTLYVSPGFAATIQETATAYIASLREISLDDGQHLMKTARDSLTGETGEVPTLSAVCTRLGGNVRDLHSRFEMCLQPEAFLVRDERVVALLENLAKHLPLFLYTNNNRHLTNRIISCLGLDCLFQHIYTIDDTWIAKPDQSMLDHVLLDTGLKPSQAFFVGDRYDVDLRLPELKGCPVYLSQNIDQLLRLEEVLEVRGIR